MDSPSSVSSEVAGFFVGAFLLAAAVAAPKVDLLVARAQRRALAVCEQCGGVKRIPCRNCRGRGTPRHGLLAFSSVLPNDKRICVACCGNGHFPCSSCTAVHSAIAPSKKER